MGKFFISAHIKCAVNDHEMSWRLLHERSAGALSVRIEVDASWEETANLLLFAETCARLARTTPNGQA